MILSNESDMKRYLIMLTAAASLASCSAEKNGVTVTLPADGPDKIVVSHHLVSDMVNAKRQSDLKTVTDTIEVVKGKAMIPVDERGAARYFIEISDLNSVEYYTQPGETLTVNIETLDPLAYSVSGSQLMDDITKLQKITTPMEQEYAKMAEKSNVTMEEVQEFMKRYDKAVVDFIKANPKSPAVAYALFNLQGESLLEAYNSLTPEAKESPLYPVISTSIEGSREQAEKERELERQIQSLADGTHPAPAFTLKDLQGKDVSLSDFRGKWVILDFWGSWCGWCIKGMPKLKEAYKEYAGKVEVIGIDCNESEADWRAGVAKYELPWVNVYNPKSSNLLQEYMIQGFPTKVIVNPAGNIADITIGEDPTFYSKLSKLVNGK